MSLTATVRKVASKKDVHNHFAQQQVNEDLAVNGRRSA